MRHATLPHQLPYRTSANASRYVALIAHASYLSLAYVATYVGGVPSTNVAPTTWASVEKHVNRRPRGFTSHHEQR